MTEEANLDLFGPSPEEPPSPEPTDVGPPGDAAPTEGQPPRRDDTTEIDASPRVQARPDAEELLEPDAQPQVGARRRGPPHEVDVPTQRGIPPDIDAADATYGDPEVDAPVEESERRRRAPPVWSVSMVNRRVRELMEGTIPALWIRGEVANWTRARSGHRYFTLKDEHAQIRAVMFRSDAERLPADPEEGLTVRAFGNLTLYEGRGEYQITVRTLEAEGDEGLWRIAFERVREALEREGLLAAERKRPLPRFPRCVGVVTSPTGAAVRDILTVIGRRAPWTRIVVRGTRVQGDGAALEVAEAIDAIGRSGLPDVVIVGRGGGSLEDLWSFNDEAVARAIARCPVPVISAVGHEVDVTIADLVADVRAATPSAGAEAAVPDRDAIRRLLGGARPRLRAGLRRSVSRRRERIADRLTRLTRGVRHLTEPGWMRVHEAEQRLTRGVRAKLSARRHALERATAKVDALSPLATMQRGYAVPLDETGRVLRGRAAFTEGDRFDLRVVDGRVPCEVRSDGDPEPAPLTE